MVKCQDSLWAMKSGLDFDEARYVRVAYTRMYTALQTRVSAWQRPSSVLNPSCLGSIGANGTSSVNDFDDTHPLSQLVLL